MEDRMRAVHLLKSVGLSEYESKAYIALISRGAPMNGYEVAKASGVPRSTIYEVLGKLVARGAATQVLGVGRATESYVAMRIDGFIDGYRTRLGETLDGLAETLPRVARKGRSQLVQTLAGRELIVGRMTDVMEKARSFLWLSIWPDIAGDLRATAAARARAGIEISSVVFGEIDDFPGLVVNHEYLSPEVTAARLGCRLFIAAADHREVVIATVEGDTWMGMWSDDLSVSLLAAEHVRYDICIQILCREMDLSGNYEGLRSNPTLQFLSRSMQASAEHIMTLVASDLVASED